MINKKNIVKTIKITINKKIFYNILSLNFIYKINELHKNLKKNIN